jgi:hypothetical protein
LGNILSLNYWLWEAVSAIILPQQELTLCATHAAAAFGSAAVPCLNACAQRI